MPQPQQGAACRVCQGFGALPNPVTGNAAVCPICAGTGIADPSVDPKPRFYYFAPIGVTASTFVLPANTLNAKQVFTVSVYDFWAIYMIASSNGVPLDNAAAGLYSVTLQDQSTRNWSDGPILSINCAGSGERPFPLPAPFKIAGNGGIFNAFFNELSGADNEIQHCLFGYEMIPVVQAPAPAR